MLSAIRLWPNAYKAAAIISIEKDKDPAIPVVKALKVREGSALDIPIMQFSWNKDLGMHSYLGEKSEKARAQRKRHDLNQLSNELFSEECSLTFSEISKAIQHITGVSERTAADYIGYMTSESIIIKDSSDNKEFVLIHNGSR